MPINYNEVMEFIFHNLNDEAGEAACVKQLTDKFGLVESDGEWAIEMFQSAVLRYGFQKNGLQFPKSNLNNDPLVKAALAVLSENLG